jgi:hypothetical protein
MLVGVTLERRTVNGKAWGAADVQSVGSRHSVEYVRALFKLLRSICVESSDCGNGIGKPLIRQSDKIRLDSRSRLDIPRHMESRAYDGFVVIVRVVKKTTAYARSSLLIIRRAERETGDLNLFYLANSNR